MADDRPSPEQQKMPGMDIRVATANVAAAAAAGAANGGMFGPTCGLKSACAAGAMHALRPPAGVAAADKTLLLRTSAAGHAVFGMVTWAHPPAAALQVRCMLLGQNSKQCGSVHAALHQVSLM